MKWAIPILIPAFAALIILISPAWCITSGSRSDKKENRKKFLIFILVSFFVAGLISGGLFAIAMAMQKYKEVWNNKIVKIRYEEKWTEKEQRSRQVSCGTDSKGNTKYRTEYYYVTETYGPYWKSVDDQHGKHTINRATYDRWAKIWGNQKKVGEHRGSAAGFGRAITGGIFEGVWPKTFETMYPYASIHRYKNKVRQAPSVLKLKEPTKELIKRYPRPADNGNTSPFVTYGSRLPEMDDLLLRRVNAKFGFIHQIHTILIPLGKNDRHLVMDILTAWRGPNKNELVTFLGHDKGEPAWCEVHSWMDNTTLHAELRDRMVSEKFTSERYAKALLEFVPKYWRRKHFADFDYLKVDMHWGWTVSSLLVSILGVWIVYLVLDGAFARASSRYDSWKWQRRRRR